MPRAAASGALERIADVPIYATDPIVRRAPALQLTADARPPRVGVPSELAAELGIVDGAWCASAKGRAVSCSPARIDPSLAANVLRVPAGHPLTAPLGATFGAVTLTREREPAGVARAEHRLRRAAMTIDSITGYGATTFGGYWPTLWAIVAHRPASSCRCCSASPT